MTSALREEVASALCEFIEAAVHVVLHARSLYPKEAFERCRIYQTQIHRCRHPKVQEYIGCVVHKIKPLLLKGTLTEVAIALLDSSGNAKQRLVLHLERLVLNIVPTDIDWSSLTGHFTNTLTKLQFLDNFGSATIEAGCNWEVNIHCSSRDGLDMTYWEPSSAGRTDRTTQGADQQQGPHQPPPDRRTAVPFKTLDVPGLLRLQVYLEEPR